MREECSSQGRISGIIDPFHPQTALRGRFFFFFNLHFTDDLTSSKVAAVFEPRAQILCSPKSMLLTSCPYFHMPIVSTHSLIHESASKRRQRRNPSPAFLLPFVPTTVGSPLVHRVIEQFTIQLQGIVGPATSRSTNKETE